MNQFTLEELEYMLLAVSRDIEAQEKQLDDIGDDIRFFIWLDESKALEKKLEKYIEERKGTPHEEAN